jgi:hypothetical protein
LREIVEATLSVKVGKRTVVAAVFAKVVVNYLINLMWKISFWFEAGLLIDLNNNL